MENHLLLEDKIFIIQFEAGILDPKLFTHEAHLRLAWLHLKQYGLEKAIEKVSNQIINYVTILGAKDKYNHTLTIAAIKTVNHFMRKSDINNFPEFINSYPRLKFNFKELLSQHYKIDIFKDENAKMKFLEPDLLPYT